MLFEINYCGTNIKCICGGWNKWPAEQIWPVEAFCPALGIFYNNFLTLYIYTTNYYAVVYLKVWAKESKKISTTSDGIICLTLVLCHAFFSVWVAIENNEKFIIGSKNFYSESSEFPNILLQANLKKFCICCPFSFTSYFPRRFFHCILSLSFCKNFFLVWSEDCLKKYFLEKRMEQSFNYKTFGRTHVGECGCLEKLGLSITP